MTLGNLSASDFFVRLRKLENAALKPRDLVSLYAIRVQPGMMQLELAKKLGYASRSNVQDCVLRLIKYGFIEDRRVVTRIQTPSDLHITAAGEALLADIVPN